MEPIPDKSLLTTESIWSALENVKDPEIPVLNVVEMGMISRLTFDSSSNSAAIYFLPTFVGCPALNYIKNNIKQAVEELGINTDVILDSETQWNSDRITPNAKLKLEKFGIAPPVELKEEELTLEQLDRVRCPHCHSTDTTLRSSFGSTLCRAIRFCFNCKQGFEQFKPL